MYRSYCRETRQQQRCSFCAKDVGPGGGAEHSLLAAGALRGVCRCWLAVENVREWGGAQKCPEVKRLEVVVGWCGEALKGWRIGGGR